MPRTIDFPRLSQTFTGQSKIAATGKSQLELDFPELFPKDLRSSAFSVGICCWPTLRSTKCVNISNRTSCSAAKCLLSTFCIILLLQLEHSPTHWYQWREPAWRSVAVQTSLRSETTRTWDPSNLGGAHRCAPWIGQ